MAGNDKYRMLNVLQNMIFESVRAITHGEEIKWCNINVEMVRLVDSIKETLEKEDAERKDSEADAECEVSG